MSTGKANKQILQDPYIFSFLRSTDRDNSNAPTSYVPLQTLCAACRAEPRQAVAGVPLLWTCTGWSQSSEPHLVQHSQTQSSQFVNMYRLVTVFRTSPGSAQSNTVKSVCEHVQAGHSLQNLTWFSTVKHSQVLLWTGTGWSQSSEPHLVQHSQTQSSTFVNRYRLVTVFRTSPGSAQSNTVKSVSWLQVTINGSTSAANFWK